MKRLRGLYTMSEVAEELNVQTSNIPAYSSGMIGVTYGKWILGEIVLD